MRDRDQRCVGTGDDDELCDAAHIIPHSKGNEVRQIFLPVPLLGPHIPLEYISHLSAQRGGIDLRLQRVHLAASLDRNEPRKVSVHSRRRDLSKAPYLCRQIPSHRVYRQSKSTTSLARVR